MRVSHALLALLVVLAGCGGQVTTTNGGPTDTDHPTVSPTPESTPSPTATPTERIRVVDGEYPGTPRTVFARVLRLTGENVSPPAIFVESPGETETNILDRERSSFRTLLGVVPANESGAGGQLTAYTPFNGYSVHIYEPVLENETRTESVFAHESVHVVQFKTDWGATHWAAQPRMSGEITYDGRMAYYLVLEGSATFVQDRYQREYLPEMAPVMPAYAAAYRNASPLARLNIARYHLGGQYVAEEANSTRDLASLHLDGPTSSEQVLHNTDEPPKTLSVHAHSGENWTVERRNRMGELFLRVALRTELNRSAAVAGADGWGDDRRVTYTAGNATGDVWVLGWDDAANATEFEATFERYLSEKATPTDGGYWLRDSGAGAFRLQRLSETTLVVYLGNESFVREATAVDDNETISVNPS